MTHRPAIGRRAFLASAAAMAIGATATRSAVGAESGGGRGLARTIPSTGEALPVVGLGTWITFNIGEDPAAQAERTEVLRAFFAAGGGMIDSRPAAA